MPDDQSISRYSSAKKNRKTYNLRTHVCVIYYPKKYRDSLTNKQFESLMGSIDRHSPDHCLCERPNVLTQQISAGADMSDAKRSDLINCLAQLALGTARYLRMLLHEMEDREAWAFLDSAIHVYHHNCSNPLHPPHNTSCQPKAAMSLLLALERRTRSTIKSLLLIREEIMQSLGHKRHNTVRRIESPPRRASPTPSPTLPPTLTPSEESRKSAPSSPHHQYIPYAQHHGDMKPIQLPARCC